MPATTPGRIRVGIGGWTFEPWRETFYPPGTSKSRELEYASRHVTSIEINGTFYRLQKPAVFAKWHDATPEEFMFSIKAPRFIVQRKDLSTAGSGVQAFLESGVTELKQKLGPILWQLAATKQFESNEIADFLALLPTHVGKQPLRHALEVRHPSFMTAAFLKIAREHQVAVVFIDDSTVQGCADLTSSFVYARLRRSAPSVKTGYASTALKRWALRAQGWAEGKAPTDLPTIEPKLEPKQGARDVFVYFINGAKERAPAAAQKLLTMLP